jgi:methylated-DNA-[protein]-cysteine S-methyltransferase
MSSTLYYVIFGTKAGRVGILGTGNGLRRATLPQDSDRVVYGLLGDKLKDASEAPERFTELIKRLQSYYSGYRTDFPDELDFSGTTAFQQAVWRAAQLIPYGETQSYAWVAARAGKPGAARAAGQALARNPLPVIVPCHRVLATGGGLGGFTGGLKMKEHLLKLEAKAITSG